MDEAKVKSTHKSMADVGFLKKLVKAATPAHGQEWPFVVMTRQEFEAMPAPELQKLFKTKHLVVKQMPYRKIKFDRRGLERLGRWEHPIHVQGKPVCLLNILSD